MNAYDRIRQAMDGKPFTMSLTPSDANAVIDAVNQGIDSHLEACSVPDRGDSYAVRCGRLECSVSAESFPVLLRRLTEAGNKEFATDCLIALGVDEIDASEIVWAL